MSRIDPGYSAWRGQVLRELARTRTHLARRNRDGGALERALRDERCLAMYIAYHQSALLAGAKGCRDEEMEARIH